MIHSRRWLSGAVTMFCAAALVGCGSETPSKPSAGTPPGITSPQAVPEGEDHAPVPALSAEDQALASAQKFCPVSDEELGGDMGSPVKLVVNGEPIFICCKSCEKKVNADPAKYLAKVAELKKANSVGDDAAAKKPEGN